MDTSLKENLDRMMKLRGLNQKRLALMAGRNETLVRDILKGRTLDPRYSTIHALAGALRCTVEDLVGTSTGEVGESSHQTIDLPVVFAPKLNWEELRTLARGEAVQLSNREAIAIPSKVKTIVAISIETGEINRLAPPGSVVVVDYGDTRLEDDRVYAIAVGKRTHARRYRRTGGPERFEPDSADPGHETIYTEPGQPLTVLGRIVMTTKDL